MRSLLERVTVMRGSLPPQDGKLHPERFTNFDFLRVLAAASVIFSHSFLIAEGSEADEPFVPWLGAIIDIYGVYIFLIMSGFLVSRSLLHSSNVTSYLWKRALRVVPALAVGAVVSGVVIASLYSAIGTDAYLLSQYGYRYIVKVILLLPVWEIPTVSFYPGYIGEGVNGVLWTIQQEVFLYIILAGLLLVRMFTPFIMAALLMIGSLFFINQTLIVESPFLVNFAYALPSFSAGAVIYFVSERFGFNRNIAIACGVILLGALTLGIFEQAFPLPGAYLTIYLGTSPSLKLPNLARFGDVSYGTYMYGWPVQQVVRSQLGENADPWILFALSLPIALCCGWLSWHMVEKRFLRWKRVDPLQVWKSLGRKRRGKG